MYTPPQTIETKVAILEEKLHTTEQLMQRIESVDAITFVALIVVIRRDIKIRLGDIFISTEE
jgi:hypothetical protein